MKIIANFRLLLLGGKIGSDKLIRKLDKYIIKYLDFRYQLDNFKVSEVDFIIDIDVRCRNKMSLYLKVLQRIGKAKGFSSSYCDCFDENTSFCLDGNGNGI